MFVVSCRKPLNLVGSDLAHPTCFIQILLQFCLHTHSGEIKHKQVLYFTEDLWFHIYHVYRWLRGALQAKRIQCWLMTRARPIGRRLRQGFKENSFCQSLPFSGPGFSHKCCISYQMLPGHGNSVDWLQQKICISAGRFVAINPCQIVQIWCKYVVDWPLWIWEQNM